MSQKATTADERFLIKLFETARRQGDPTAEIDFAAIAKSLGIKDIALKNMVKHLAQANLIQKVSESKLSLTMRGCSLVLGLLE